VIGRAIRTVDRWQQRSRPAGFVVGVVKKYGDDRGGQLAALVTFSAFLSFFPLMLVVVTVTAFVARRSPELAERIRTSAVAEFPVVGAELTSDQAALPGSGLGLGVGLAALSWGGFGFTQAIQYAFHEVWHVPHKSRPSFGVRMKRGVLLLGLLVVALGASIVLGLVGSVFGGSRLVGAAGLLGACVTSGGLFLAIFWLLSPRDAGLSELLPGAVFAALGWQALQTLGVRLVGHQLRRSSDLYGAIGAALGLVWFLLLSSQIFLYALEITVVRKDRLWPRSIVQPPLTGPDMALLAAMAKQEERRPEERVSVQFDGPIGSQDDGVKPNDAPATTAPG
jgi:YihY family inner membrane protein